MSQFTSPLSKMIHVLDPQCRNLIALNWANWRT